MATSTELLDTAREWLLYAKGRPGWGNYPAVPVSLVEGLAAQLVELAEVIQSADARILVLTEALAGHAKQCPQCHEAVKTLLVEDQKREDIN